MASNVLNVATSPRTWVIVFVALAMLYVLALWGKDPVSLAQQQRAPRIAA
jgi:hypothetical protein